MMVKPMRTLELHYPIIQVLINLVIITLFGTVAHFASWRSFFSPLKCFIAHSQTHVLVQTVHPHPTGLPPPQWFSPTLPPQFPFAFTFYSIEIMGRKLSMEFYYSWCSWWNKMSHLYPFRCGGEYILQFVPFF